MKKVRVTGIVKLANRVRQELTGPVTADRLSQLQDQLTSTNKLIQSYTEQFKVDNARCSTFWTPKTRVSIRRSVWQRAVPP